MNYQIVNSKVYLQYEAGNRFIDVITPEIIRVADADNIVPSKAIEGEKHQHVELQVREEADKLVIETGVLTVNVFDGFYVDVYKADGTLLCADYRGNRVGKRGLSQKTKEIMEAEGHDTSGVEAHAYTVQVLKAMDGDEKFYGLGDKSGFLNKREYEYENWNTDNPQAHTEAFLALYKTIPFLITLKDVGVYGIFFDNTYRSRMNMGKESKEYYFYGAEGGALDYYFIGGSCMKDVVSNYTYLTGRTPLPQLWTLGYHQCRWGYECSEDIREVADKYRELQIPCDSIHIDIDYMEGFRVFTWNEEAFGKKGELVKEIREKGFKAVCIIDPGVKKDEGYYMYDEGVANGYFGKTTDGNPYVNVVWPGDTVYPDFGNPEVRNWWSKQHKFLTDIGVRGVWNDMNEPASFKGDIPLDVVFTDDGRITDHAEMHNVYGHLMSKATYEGLKREDGKRPFVITRACYAGTQKYAMVWTGDNQSLWAHLRLAIPQLLSLGISGVTFAGTDVGGCGADCTAELLCRWVQVGAFSPFFRNHSAKSTIRQEPWQFDEKTIEINRKFIELRYQLLPYFYDLFHECEETGLPVIRPLVLHYEKDPEVWNLNEEFLLGDSLLIAPVVDQGATKKIVYLPEGRWFDFFTGETYEGGRYHMVDAPIDTCPMFAKEGSIIPTWDVQQYVGEKTCDVLKLLVFPGKGKYVHYQDNGEDFDYQKGIYNLYEFVSDGEGSIEQKMLHEGYENKYKQVDVINM